MKKIFSTIALSIFIPLFGFAQTPVWEEDYQFDVLADQADGGSVSLDITNTGATVQECISKAKSQALFTIIFKGYPASNSASASTALSDISKYNQNLDFFKNYLSSNTAGLAFVNRAETNTSKPGGKLDKKTIKTTTTVYILKTKLKEDLQKQGYVESAASISKSLGITPKIMIVPANAWMKAAGFHSSVNSSSGSMDQYDYQKALSSPAMGVFQIIEGNLKQPLQKNGFEIADLGAQLNQIAQENARNSMRETGIEQSGLDLLAKTAGANIWLNVSVITEDLSSVEKQYQITLNGIDPLTMTSVINGLPQIVKSSGNNETKLITTAVNAAIDNLMPEITNFFKKRDQEGLPVIVTFMKGEDASFDFGSTIKVKGRPMPMAKMLDGVMNKVTNQSSPSGAASATRRQYDAIIPSKVTDVISGKIVANNAESLAYEVAAALEEFGITAGVEVETVGLGKVFVIFKQDL